MIIQPQHHYFHSGLQISSDWAISDWKAFETSPPSGAPDVRIQIRDSEVAHQHGDYWHEVPEVGLYVIRGGSEIIVLLEPNGDPREANAILAASAWGALCHQRGLLLLHGSAVRIGGRVFAFSGHSGAGKSTTVACLAQKGYEMVVDDIGRLDIVDDKVMLYPSAKRLKLWGETVRSLGRESDDLTRLYAQTDKYYVPMPGQSTVYPTLVDAIYILMWGDLTLRRLIGVDALKHFLRAGTYRPEFIGELGLEGTAVRNALEVVERVPIYELSRPKDLSEMGDAITLLERHWDNDFPQTKDAQR